MIMKTKQGTRVENCSTELDHTDWSGKISHSQVWNYGKLGAEIGFY